MIGSYVGSAVAFIFAITVPGRAIPDVLAEDPYLGGLSLRPGGPEHRGGLRFAQARRRQGGRAGPYEGSSRGSPHPRRSVARLGTRPYGRSLTSCGFQRNALSLGPGKAGCYWMVHPSRAQSAFDRPDSLLEAIGKMIPVEYQHRPPC